MTKLGLRLRAGAVARQRDSELQCAAALRKRAERRRQLAAVLRRCVPVYQAGPSRLHAPVEMDQAAFERVVCILIEESRDGDSMFRITQIGFYDGDLHFQAFRKQFLLRGDCIECGPRELRFYALQLQIVPSPRT